MIPTPGLVIRVAALFAAVLSIGGCIVIDGRGWGDSHARFERTVELQHPMPPGSTLVVSTASGSIDVTGQDTDQGRVVATIQARASTEEEAQELAEQVQIRFQEDGNRLEIKADKPSLNWNRSISISYIITVPRQTHMNCESSSGSLKLRDLIGNVDAHTSSGSAEAARIKGAVRLRSSSGSVHCDTVSGGDVDLDTSSGSVHLSNASELGTCRTHSSSGSVRLQHVQTGSLRMDATSGSATGDDINCTQLKAGSSSGHVSVTFSPSAPGNVTVDLGASSGSINVTLPPTFAGRVDLSANSGSVHIDQPVTIQGDINKRHIIGALGQGTGTLSAHTSSGSINVR
jgi:DUF4097 and DUF4098 domain-containing protein YvlB